MAAAGLVLFAICGASCRAGSSRRAPVFLISIDTLRADHLRAFAPTPDAQSLASTPAIDALAKDSLVFDLALSHVPLTLPSHATIFTGRLPFENGVRDNLGYRLGAASPTLAAFLKDRGYVTGGAVSAAVLAQATGIARGFDFWDDRIEAERAGEALGDVQRAGSDTERRLEEWIAGAGQKRPIFGFLHLYEPHAPYTPPEPFASRYRSRPYDGEIAAADAVVGRFMEFLKRSRLYDRSVIVFLSDHGEGLNDHGEAEHGIFLYREALRVPLMIKLPGKSEAGRRIADPVGLSDVFPTIASVLGAEAPPGLSGHALWPLRAPNPSRRIYGETIFPRLHFGWSDLASLADARDHFILAPRPELYAWDRDPAEREDRAASRPAAFRALSAALAGMNRPLAPPGAADPETARKLASLGYVSARSSEPEHSNFPDPKDGIATIEILRAAGRSIATGDASGGIALLNALVRAHPDMRDAREALAGALQAAGRQDAAYAQLLEVDRRWPGSPHVLLRLAGLALTAGDAVKASSFAAAADALGSSEAPPVLAAIALARGDAAKARGSARRAIEANPESRASWLLLARAELLAGDAAGALAAAGKTEAHAGERPLPDAAYLRGDALARLGRTVEARAAFAEEIRAFPANPRGYTGLALLAASENRLDETHRILTELLARAPSREAFEVAAKTWDLVGDRASSARARADGARRYPPAR